MPKPSKDKTHVTDKGLGYLADSAKLTSVNCSGPNVTDRAIEAIADFPNLRWLALDEHRDRTTEFAIRNPEGVRYDR